MSKSGLVDSHLHLQSFEPGTDVKALIDKAVDSGVSNFVCNATCEKDWHAVLELSSRFPRIVPCLGLHPWFVNGRTENWLSELDALVSGNRCGIGEIGLDKLAEHFDPQAQEQVFISQLDLARKHSRPVTLHCVKAWGRLMDILNSQPPIPSGFLLHAYSGSTDLIRPLVRLGAYFSFSGITLVDNFKRMREAIQSVPSDRLLIESDAPFMIPPERFRPHCVVSNDANKLNHPANLHAIMEGLAELLGQSPEQLQETLWDNSQRFFGDLLTAS